MDNGNIEKLAEMRWRADWTTDEGEISAIAPPFCQSVKEHYLNDARKVFAALSEAGLEVVESWKPIASAPKLRDGPLIELAGKDWVTPGYWDADRDEWWELNTNWFDHCGLELEPTHWRPRPATLTEGE